MNLDEALNELRSRFRSELSDDDLDKVAGGNDDKPGGGKSEGIPFTCPFCNKTFLVYQFEDAPKHVTQDCPNNPYK